MRLSQGRRRARRSRGSPPEARSYALKLLYYRPRSLKEMRWRLVRRGYDEEEIDKTLDLLQESGLIEDRSLAEGLVRDAIERRLLGRKGIEAFLRHRGIDRDLIDEVLSHHSDDIELETAKRLIEKRLRTLQGQSREVMKRRLRGMLTRRGIAGDVIERALSEAGL